MATTKRNKKSKRRTKRNTSKQTQPAINTETKEGITAIVLFVIALVLAIAGFGGAGVAGSFIYSTISEVVGVGYALLPIVAGLLGLTYISAFSPRVALPRAISAALFVLSGLAILDIALAEGAQAGGILGHAIAYPFVTLFDVYVSIIILGGVFISSLILMFNKKPNFAFLGTWLAALKDRFSRSEEVTVTSGSDDDDEETEEEPQPEPAPSPATEEETPKAPPVHTGDDTAEEDEEFAPGTHADTTYEPPPLSILNSDKGKPNTGDVKANANIIKRTLQNFGIEVEMDEVVVGPTVTRYALKPAEGVKLSRIVGLQNDLSLALAAHPLRIQAPIPGKSLVGIEVPNQSKATVGLASMLKSKAFQTKEDPLLMAIGKNIAGIASYSNLAKMPHLLIAGATGSGKSVTIHALITSLLYRKGPAELRFIMVDPKRVELTMYNKIPHLLTPVIKQPKKAIQALKWAAKEMERRYDILEAEQVRDISTYHSEVVAKAGPDEEIERMPYIVIIIDELADIMQSYPRELESAIVRLAQMSRAVGIHLLLSTQRPSVNVITGLIKANIPARIALQVSSQVDSRTILDTSGAEKLLGAGDMLYNSGDMAQPERLQSAFITEGEVKKVVKHLAAAYKDELPDDIAFGDDESQPENAIFSTTLDEDEDEDAELFAEAKDLVIKSKKASTSYIQRKLKVGYSRAARIMDLLEEHGVVGPQNGSKPREVLLDDEESTTESSDNPDEETYEQDTQ